jgi:2-oxoglutarate ferredoxin oxidoreductase subunit beta
LDGLTPVIINLSESGVSTNDLWIHDEKDKTKANIISRFFDTSFNEDYFPRPFGVMYASERPVYEEDLKHQRQKKLVQKKEEFH